MKVFVLTTVVLTFLLVSVNSSHAQLPPEVEADILQAEIIDNIKGKDFKSAKANIARYRALKVEMPPAIILIDAKVALALADPIRAKKVLEEYFRKAGKTDSGYKGALQLYRNVMSDDKVKKHVQIEKSRKAQQQKMQSLRAIAALLKTGYRRDFVEHLFRTDGVRIVVTENTKATIKLIGPHCKITLSVAGIHTSFGHTQRLREKIVFDMKKFSQTDIGTKQLKYSYKAKSKTNYRLVRGKQHCATVGARKLCYTSKGDYDKLVSAVRSHKKNYCGP